ncbi:MAG: hypothetical protein KJ645_05005 [Planctomycetes bacterium]|nr:hypothetical protein [Planctomycetota bacterium]
MRYLQAFKTLCNGRTLIVALIFSGIVYYYYSHKDWSLEVRVAQDKRIDLMALLDQVELLEGFEEEVEPLGFFVF